MVSIDVSTLGSTDLIFIVSGANITGMYYRDVVLGRKLRYTTEETFIFQQSNESSHPARDTVKYLSQHAPEFIPPWSWSPSGPDLDPADYTKSEACSRDEFIVPGSTVSTTLSSVLSKSDIASTEHCASCSTVCVCS